MKSIEIKVPRNLIQKFYPHPEPYGDGDYVVDLINYVKVNTSNFNIVYLVNNVIFKCRHTLFYNLTLTLGLILLMYYVKIKMRINYINKI